MKTLSVDKMDMEDLKEAIKILIENSCHEHDRLTALQDRVLKLELKEIK